MTNALRATLAAVLLLAATPLAHAAAEAAPKGAERTLTYKILMGADPIGTETVRLTPKGDTMTVDVQASTKVRVLFVNFHYAHQRQELWTNGVLTAMTAKTDDDGDDHTIAMTRRDGGYALTVDGKAEQVPANALPLTLWTPEVLKRPTLFSVIDAKPYTVHADTVGMEAIDLHGRTVEARHSRIRGDVDRDLWYAADGTLLKTTFKRSGYDITYILD